MADLPAFGEGFYVTMGLIVAFLLLSITCIATKATLDNVQVVVALAGAIGLSTIVMFWFTSRPAVQVAQVEKIVQAEQQSK
jgi:NADH:ubiquinone oxidoreductase subunit 6 (subunit J)